MTCEMLPIMDRLPAMHTMNAVMIQALSGASPSSPAAAATRLPISSTVGTFVTTFVTAARNTANTARRGSETMPARCCTSAHSEPGMPVALKAATDTNTPMM
eukprot:CAMPEP_0177662574 /NCGR_PEP_ID=MMETSP0447-20121125/19381_1 /TAXON_ID=0 /ORGANISM="Stygamoeba regulata, Strain BSH-02190019" /LENGTH=101 /DNA_ID=CAMNT_0019168185 /DNA_START=301 /DNA_END=606 /DNA_ORIENTATION=+